MKKILVKDNGEWRVRDTVWAGWPQAMVHSDGTAKCLKMIMQERGINPSTLKADNMWTILSNYDNFLNKKTEVEHYIEGWGFLCLFPPKFHCELNPTDRVWGQPKRYRRAYSNFTVYTVLPVPTKYPPCKLRATNLFHWSGQQWN